MTTEKPYVATYHTEHSKYADSVHYFSTKEKALAYVNKVNESRLRGWAVYRGTDGEWR